MEAAGAAVVAAEVLSVDFAVVEAAAAVVDSVVAEVLLSELPVLLSGVWLNA